MAAPAAPPETKTPKLMTTADVDGKLRQLAGFLRRTPAGVERKSALIACDRLLDIRLEIRGAA